MVLFKCLSISCILIWYLKPVKRDNLSSCLPSLPAVFRWENISANCVQLWFTFHPLSWLIMASVLCHFLVTIALPSPLPQIPIISRHTTPTDKTACCDLAHIHKIATKLRPLLSAWTSCTTPSTSPVARDDASSLQSCRRFSCCTWLSIVVSDLPSIFIYRLRKYDVLFKQPQFQPVLVIFSPFRYSWLLLKALRQATMIFSGGVKIIRTLVLLLRLHTLGWQTSMPAPFRTSLRPAKNRDGHSLWCRPKTHVLPTKKNEGGTRKACVHCTF